MATLLSTTVNGTLYATALYDAGSRVAISRGEGRDYINYSRYVYNNGAYSGSGWIEPSDLGVRYANSAGSISGYNNPTTAATANTIVYRDGNGHITGNYILGSYFNSSAGNSENPTIGQIWTQSTGDNYLRKSTPAHLISQLGLITTSSIGSQSVNYASSAGSVAWSNVSSRPTALSQFSNDLGNYGGWITSSGSISGNAATATRTSGQSGYPHAGTGLWAFYNWGGSNGGTSAPTDSTYTVGISVGSNPGDQAYGFQIGRNMWNDGIWVRGYDSSWRSWYRVIDSSNIGSQSVSYSTNSGQLDGYGRTNYLGKSGNSYYQADTWIQLNGGHGLYAPSYYSAHLYPNVDSTYTQWALNGSKNSYGGIYDVYSRVNGFMYDSAGNGGVYREANGLWYFYYHIGNNCMGIGTSTTSSSYKMYVDGTIYATGDVIAYSDSRKKTNIVTIDNALDKVLSMRGVFYDKIDELQNGRQVGVIAQEVNEILPEAVSYASDVDEYGVKYGNIVGVLIESIKEQQAQIAELKAEVKKLKGE